MIAEKISYLSELVCSTCNQTYNAHVVQTFASCEKCGKSPLLARYELPKELSKHNIDETERSLWRYFEMLPVQDEGNIVTLGEGWTPTFNLSRTASLIGTEKLWMKDESLNPTGSFKSRGLSVAISKAKELGITDCIVPTAGNAGVALAAYCAKAGMNSTIVMPAITPKGFVNECRLYGGDVILVNGLIDACAAQVAELNHDNRYFDFSTMKEPYRLEGKKTMGYEIAEQFNWSLPDVILYPTGGGTGLIGIWKAFHEMKELGWISGPLPRMIAVQSEKCEPVVYAARHGGSLEGLKVSSSLAYGLNVPRPFALSLILQVLNESRGEAISVSEQEVLAGAKEIIKQEGILICPEGAALLAALKKLLAAAKISPDENILMLNTGCGAKYLDELI